jgi:hypothetical protein
MARRSRPPRNRKSRSPDAPPRDVAVIIPPTDSPAEELARGAVEVAVAPAPVDAELAELDAGWD